MEESLFNSLRITLVVGPIARFRSYLLSSYTILYGKWNSEIALGFNYLPVAVHSYNPAPVLAWFSTRKWQDVGGAHLTPEWIAFELDSNLYWGSYRLIAPLVKMSRVSNFGKIRGMTGLYLGRRIGKFQLWPRSSVESMTPQDGAFNHFHTHRSRERAI